MGESVFMFQPKNREGSVFVKGVPLQNSSCVCRHDSVAVDQLNVADLNFNASSVVAVVGQVACVIIYGVHLVHLAMFFSGSQHIAGHTIRATIQGQVL